MPSSTCFFTTVSTAPLTALANAAPSTLPPDSRAFIGAMTSGRRARLPTWVVIMRSVLRFMASLLRFLSAKRSLPHPHPSPDELARGAQHFGLSVHGKFPLPLGRVRERVNARA